MQVKKSTTEDTEDSEKFKKELYYSFSVPSVIKKISGYLEKIIQGGKS